MKHARQAKILEIIDKEVIETQEEIADRLKLYLCIYLCINLNLCINPNGNQERVDKIRNSVVVFFYAFSAKYNNTKGS